MLGKILKYRNIFLAILALAGLVTATFAAGTVVDLTPSTAIKYVGQPNHGTWCNYLNVAEADRINTDGKFNILPNTELSGDATVSTNYGEVVTTTVSGNTVSFSTKYGLSGSVYVCVSATDAAKPWGAIGFGNPPTAAKAEVEYLAGKAQYQMLNVNTVRVANIRLKTDGTSFDVSALAATKIVANLNGVPLDECIADTAKTCTFNAPENLTFNEVGRGMYVTLTITNDGKTDPKGAVMGLDKVP